MWVDQSILEIFIRKSLNRVSATKTEKNVLNRKQPDLAVREKNLRVRALQLRVP